MFCRGWCMVLLVITFAFKFEYGITQSTSLFERLIRNAINSANQNHRRMKRQSNDEPNHAPAQDYFTHSAHPLSNSYGQSGYNYGSPVSYSDESSSINDGSQDASSSSYNFPTGIRYSSLNDPSSKPLSTRLPSTTKTSRYSARYGSYGGSTSLYGGMSSYKIPQQQASYPYGGSNANAYSMGSRGSYSNPGSYYYTSRSGYPQQQQYAGGNSYSAYQPQYGGGGYSNSDVTRTAAQYPYSYEQNARSYNPYPASNNGRQSYGTTYGAGRGYSYQTPMGNPNINSGSISTQGHYGYQQSQGYSGNMATGSGRMSSHGESQPSSESYVPTMSDGTSEGSDIRIGSSSTRYNPSSIGSNKATEGIYTGHISGSSYPYGSSLGKNQYGYQSGSIPYNGMSSSTYGQPSSNSYYGGSTGSMQYSAGGNSQQYPSYGQGQYYGQSSSMGQYGKPSGSSMQSQYYRGSSSDPYGSSSANRYSGIPTSGRQGSNTAYSGQYYGSSTSSRGSQSPYSGSYGSANNQRYSGASTSYPYGGSSSSRGSSNRHGDSTGTGSTGTAQGNQQRGGGSYTNERSEGTSSEYYVGSAPISSERYNSNGNNEQATAGQNPYSATNNDDYSSEQQATASRGFNGLPQYPGADSSIYSARGSPYDALANSGRQEDQGSMHTGGIAGQSMNQAENSASNYETGIPYGSSSNYPVSGYGTNSDANPSNSQYPQTSDYVGRLSYSGAETNPSHGFSSQGESVESESSYNQNPSYHAGSRPISEQSNNAADSSYQTFLGSSETSNGQSNAGSVSSINNQRGQASDRYPSYGEGSDPQTAHTNYDSDSSYGTYTGSSETNNGQSNAGSVSSINNQRGQASDRYSSYGEGSDPRTAHTNYDSDSSYGTYAGSSETNNGQSNPGSVSSINNQRGQASDRYSSYGEGSDPQTAHTNYDSDSSYGTYTGSSETNNGQSNAGSVSSINNQRGQASDRYSSYGEGSDPRTAHTNYDSDSSYGTYTGSSETNNGQSEGTAGAETPPKSAGEQLPNSYPSYNLPSRSRGRQSSRNNEPTENVQESYSNAMNIQTQGQSRVPVSSESNPSYNTYSQGSNAYQSGYDDPYSDSYDDESNYDSVTPVSENQQSTQQPSTGNQGHYGVQVGSTGETSQYFQSEQTEIETNPESAVSSNDTLPPIQTNSESHQYGYRQTYGSQDGVFILQRRNISSSGHRDVIQRTNENVETTAESQRETIGLPDLQLDKRKLITHFFLDRKPLSSLLCARGAGCLSSSAYGARKSSQRKLLRFQTTVKNIGTAAFLPALGKSDWLWHTCHNHSHSMEIFTHYDLLNDKRKKVAEGHKASFCLEDSSCKRGVRKVFNCDRGHQGISAGCEDTYKASIDCQWIDVTEVYQGDYIFRVNINPDRLVPESSYENNGIECKVSIKRFTADIWNCKVIGV